MCVIEIVIPSFIGSAHSFLTRHFCAPIYKTGVFGVFIQAKGRARVVQSFRLRIESHLISSALYRAVQQ